MDGVLFNTIPLAREAFLSIHPGTTEEMYNELHSGNYHEEAGKLKHLKIPETAEEKSRRLGAYAREKSRAELFAGIKDLLAECRDSGCRLVLNTNAYDRNCLPLLENVHIKDFFDFVASADTSTDKVAKFKMIADRYGVGAADMLFVTDALGDVRDAEKAKVPAIAVTWGVHDRFYLEKERHLNLIAIVSTVPELGQKIKNYFAG